MGDGHGTPARVAETATPGQQKGKRRFRCPRWGWLRAPRAVGTAPPRVSQRSRGVSRVVAHMGDVPVGPFVPALQRRPSTPRCSAP